MKKRFICIALALFAMSQMVACGNEAPAEELGTISNGNTITLNGNSIEISGTGMSVSGNVVTISALGSYTVTGKLSDGQIVVDIKDESAASELILDNVHITNTAGPAIHVETGKDLKLKFKGENSVISGTPVMESNDNASGAALYAEDDMSIKGEDGAVLNVVGYINNGIACKNDLDIKGGTINVNAANNGIRGSDSVEIKGGTITVEAGNDGVKSTTVDKEGKGYINIEGGSLSVSAKGDGIAAETTMNISGGIINVISTGDPALGSCKGIKANSKLEISGGEISVNSQDHALESDADIVISGGSANLISNVSKAVKVDGQLNISGGNVSLFGQEDAVDSIGDVNISGGELYVKSVHDGIQAGEANSGKGDINISGGKVIVDSYKLAFNPRGILNISGGSVLSVSNDNKTVSGQGFNQKGWNGVKGDELVLAKDGTEESKLTAGYGFKNVLVGIAEGKVTLSDGKITVEMN